MTTHTLRLFVGNYESEIEISHVGDELFVSDLLATLYEFIRLLPPPSWNIGCNGYKLWTLFPEQNRYLLVPVDSPTIEGKFDDLIKIMIGAEAYERGNH